MQCLCVVGKQYNFVANTPKAIPIVGTINTLSISEFVGFYANYNHFTTDS